MKLDRVLFIGGAPHLPSVSIRCVEIARHLGCDYVVPRPCIDEISSRYEAFICVKPRLNSGELFHLQERGKVIWDIIDEPPPRLAGSGRYIASSETVRKIFSGYGEIDVIPHYHCNFSGALSCLTPGKVAWVGSPQWHPGNIGFKYSFFNTNHLDQPKVEKIYQDIGISLNLRADKAGAVWHGIMNSGIKLINAIGFGIPSVSINEPAYLEIGDECTIFTDTLYCRESVLRLQKDTSIYRRMSRSCLLRAGDYHIETIALRYKKIIDEL